ncbi:hypothetical protein [Brucella intermedia]|uniref:hypothetical protein n=1 Tax=Brucella intermedia TaxID=94625 RepID=UPI00159106C7|nr:hypothetical protein [Brucella intermedia]
MFIYLPPFSAPPRRNKGNSGLFRFLNLEFSISIQITLPLILERLVALFDRASKNKKFGEHPSANIVRKGKPQAKEKPNG